MNPTPESLTEAVRLLNEVYGGKSSPVDPSVRVLATVLDEHKAFKRRVDKQIRNWAHMAEVYIPPMLECLLIPEPADPLVDAVTSMQPIKGESFREYAGRLREALAKRNARIVFDAPDKPDAAAVWEKACSAMTAVGMCGGREAAIAVIAEALGQGEG